MVKRRLVTFLVGLALLAAATGLSGIAADSLGYSVTPQAMACGSSAGGGC